MLHQVASKQGQQLAIISMTVIKKLRPFNLVTNALQLLEHLEQRMDFNFEHVERHVEEIGDCLND